VGQRPTEEEINKQYGGDDDGTANDNSPTGPATQALGLSLQSITPQIAQALRLPAGTSGVVITAIDPSSDAAQKGLQRGDLIVAVQGQRVSTPAQVGAAVAAAKKAGRTSVLLLVKRGTSPEAFVGIDISG
jgi:serine protease Do